MGTKQRVFLVAGNGDSNVFIRPMEEVRPVSMARKVEEDKDEGKGKKKRRVMTARERERQEEQSKAGKERERQEEEQHKEAKSSNDKGADEKQEETEDEFGGLSDDEKDNSLSQDMATEDDDYECGICGRSEEGEEGREAVALRVPQRVSKGRKRRA